MEEKIEEIKDKIRKHSKEIFIERVPLKTHKRFMELAHGDEFCGDYGFLLKYFVDFHDGLLPLGNEHLEIEVSVLKEEVEKLKLALVSKKEEEKPASNRLG